MHHRPYIRISLASVRLVFAYGRLGATAAGDAARDIVIVVALGAATVWDGGRTAGRDYYRAALSTMPPARPPLHSALGTALRRWRKEEALAEFDVAVRLDPTHPIVRTDVAAALKKLGLPTTRCPE